MTHELKGREILKVGHFNGVDISSDDLDDIVSNFDKLKDTHKVPLKFGHDANHNDGQPAIGWIERIFKVGETLFADFTHMPRIVLEAIKNKLYRTVSVELLFNVDSDGNKFNHVLDAVALLGADHPAVTSLADLDALLATRTRFTGGHRVAFETIAGTVKKLKHTSEVVMDKKEIQELIDSTTEPLKLANADLVKKLEASVAKNVKFSQEKADNEKNVQEKAVKLARKNVTDVLDAAVKAKSLTPALRETYEKQIGIGDDARVVDINLEEVKSMFSIKGTDGQTGLHKDTDNNDDDPEAKLMVLTRETQVKTGEKDFSVAFSLTCTANPKLHLAYLNSNGEA